MPLYYVAATNLSKGIGGTGLQRTCSAAIWDKSVLLSHMAANIGVLNAGPEIHIPPDCLFAFLQHEQAFSDVIWHLKTGVRRLVDAICSLIFGNCV